MHFLISPAKSLDFETPLRPVSPTQPQFLEHAQRLVDGLKQMSATQIAQLMHLSPALAALNAQRYAAWACADHQGDGRPAILAFNGDVYSGLDAVTLSDDDLAWSQQHVSILSGLYGVLKPLDCIQAYRLEMGTALSTSRGKNLYAFWGDTVAQYLNQRVATEAAPVIVNLASQEYFKVVARPTLTPRVIDCVFEDWKAGQYKVISFFAKRARGMMLRYAVQKRCLVPQALEHFNAQGYVFDDRVSEPDRLVYRRRAAAE